MKRIVLFGAGALSRLLTDHIRSDVQIVAYYVTGMSGEINGVPIVSDADGLAQFEYDFIVVAFGNAPQGVEMLKKMGIPEEKIVGYAYSGISYEENIIQNRCNQLLREVIRNEKCTELFDLPQKRYYFCGMNVQEDQSIIRKDFVREQTLSFIAEEINRKKVEGAVADIGVSDGDFGWKINTLFPDRVLYFFDTFDGLPESDKEYAISIGWGEKQYAISEKGVNPENVLSIMPHKEKCIIKAGRFPDTFDLNEPLAFVSIDIDFYAPTRIGLEKVYPFLSEGGYIMAHDFHNLAFPDGRKAILDFCEEKRVPYVPIPDFGGSVVIVK